jgi:hypothetical protein
MITPPATKQAIVRPTTQTQREEAQSGLSASRFNELIDLSTGGGFKATSTSSAKLFSSNQAARFCSAAGLQQPVAWHNDSPGPPFSASGPGRCPTGHESGAVPTIGASWPGQTVMLAPVCREAWSALS